jgi:hypothetical protein
VSLIREIDRKQNKHNRDKSHCVMHCCNVIFPICSTKLSSYDVLLSFIIVFYTISWGAYPSLVLI